MAQNAGNLLAVRVPPRTPLGELTTLSQTRSWWLPLSKDPTPGPLPLTRNRMLGSSQHDGLDPATMMSNSSSGDERC